MNNKHNEKFDNYPLPEGSDFFETSQQATTMTILKKRKSSGKRIFGLSVLIILPLIIFGLYYLLLVYDKIENAQKAEKIDDFDPTSVMVKLNRKNDDSKNEFVGTCLSENYVLSRMNDAYKFSSFYIETTDGIKENVSVIDYDGYSKLCILKTNRSEFNPHLKPTRFGFFEQNADSIILIDKGNFKRYDSEMAMAAFTKNKKEEEWGILLDKYHAVIGIIFWPDPQNYDYAFLPINALTRDF